MESFTKGAAALATIQAFFIALPFVLLSNLLAVHDRALPSALLLAGSACSAFAAYAPEKQWARVITCALSLGGLYFAIWSPVKVSHQYFGWIYALIVLSASTLREPKKALFYAQFLSLSVYALAGFWKLLDAAQQCFRSVVSQCAVGGFSNVLAESLLENNAHALLGDFFLNHAWIGFVSFWIVMIYQLAVLFLFLKFPKWGALFALGIVAFHVMVYLVMYINFFPQVLVLLILFALPACLERGLKASGA